MRARGFSAVIGSLLFVLPGAHAQTTIDQTLDLLSITKRFTEVAITTDGQRVAWVDDGVWIQDLPNGSAKRLSACKEKCAERGVAFSPDGSKVAFLSDAAKSGQDQVYVAARSGKPRRLTDETGYFQDLKWSPDGRQIAVLFTANATRNLGPVEAVLPETGVIEDKYFVQRLAIVDAHSGAMRHITPEKTYVFEYDWSPDSKQLVYDSAPPPGDDNWYYAEINAIDAAGGSPRHLYKPSLQIAEPRWSPDGRSIAFIEGLMSDEGVTGGEIYIMPAEGGTPKDVTPGWKSSPSDFSWLPDSKGLLITDHISGATAFQTLDLASGSASMLWKGEEGLTFAGSASASVVIRNSWTAPPEVWAGPIGQWRQLTHANQGLNPQWGKVESVEWQNDNFRVQGWLLFPLNVQTGRKYPMVVSVHGGPASERRPAWPSTFFDLSILSAQGYFVFFPNPRGSYGQGEAFTRANVKDFGYGDLRDILTGVDKVVHDYPVDDKRVGIAGWSYGGYMTMWAVTQTNRFYKAVSGAGLSNWQSYYGENSIDQWMIPYFGASVYDDPAVYAKSSPMNFIKKVKTPTLVVVGEMDGEVPEPQSREFWHALKTLGVKTQLVVYQGEGHRFHDSTHIRDLMQRTAAWFNE